MAQGVINQFREWLFGPRETAYCRNCEMLQEQLAFANYDRKMLLENFVKIASPKEENPDAKLGEELQPLRNTKYVPWRVRQQELEGKSRQEAELRKPRVDKLEEELGLKDWEERNGISRETVQGSEQSS